MADWIAAMLADDTTVRATIIRERLQADGYRGGITILSTGGSCSTSSRR